MLARLDSVSRKSYKTPGYSYVGEATLMFQLAQLSCFIAAAEEGHFGRAAERLNMAQPTLSRQIQGLEQALKVTLFERANRAVKLTASGRIFLPEAKRIVGLAESAANLARQAWRGELGTIRLGFTATAAYSLLPPLLNRAAADLPELRISLKEGTSAEQEAALLADELDVAILRPSIDRSRFSERLLHQERYIAAVHVQDPRAKKQALTPKDFHQQPFIMYSADGASYSHGLLTAMFNREHVTPTFTHYLDQNASILAFVAAGMGAALLPYSMTFVSCENVVFKEVVVTPVEPLELYMVWRPANSNPALPAFLTVCENLFPASPSA
jgi:DNA-binding transcriptional LysR family regulator